MLRRTSYSPNKSEARVASSELQQRKPAVPMFRELPSTREDNNTTMSMSTSKGGERYARRLSFMTKHSTDVTTKKPHVPSPNKRLIFSLNSSPQHKATATSKKFDMLSSIKKCQSNSPNKKMRTTFNSPSK